VYHLQHAEHGSIYKEQEKEYRVTQRKEEHAKDRARSEEKGYQL